MSRQRLQPDAYEYVRNYYRVPAYVGVRVQGDGEAGVIVKPRVPDQYVHVLFDGKKHAVPVHPKELTYSVAGTGAHSDGR